MSLRTATAAAALTGAALFACWSWPTHAAGAARPVPPSEPPFAGPTEQATLGGGCFWCVEAALEQLRGVKSVENGYAGGKKARPTYEEVCAGGTGHAEVVRVTFDPTTIAYRDLLRAFFVVHDPTTKDRQGNDVGAQYRSIVLTHSEAQAATAKAVMAELAPSFGRPLTTEVVPAGAYWRAEEYHQDYFAKHPDQPYCAFVVAPKVEKLRHAFVDKLKK
jgi:peptide-methionine (S)-S-oxide reductase